MKTPFDKVIFLDDGGLSGPKQSKNTNTNKRKETEKRGINPFFAIIFVLLYVFFGVSKK